MEEERLVWLDVVRSFAISTVVFCHAFEQVYDMSLTGWKNLEYGSKIFRALSFTLGRIGVPLFGLLTGFLILGKAIENDKDCVRFYKKKLLPMFICTEIWIILYYLFNSFIAGRFLDVKVLLRNVFFLEHTQMTNMWYMPMILGIYFVLPFLAVIFRHFSLHSLIWPLVISLIANFIMPSINIVFNIYNKQTYDLVLNLIFLGGWLGLYIFMGYFLYKYNRKRHTTKLLVYFMISFLSTSFFQFIILDFGYEYNLWYNFIGLFITSIFLFELLKGFEKSVCYKLYAPAFSYISKISLGIFFLHKPVLICVDSLFNEYDLPQPLKAIGLFVVAFCFCVIIIWCLSKIKFIRRQCFLIDS